MPIEEPRLALPRKDVGVWGAIINQFLRVSHNEDGTLKLIDGISDGKILVVDGSPSVGEYARFTANGLEGAAISADIDSEFTQDSGILVGTGPGAFQEETGATLRTSIGVDVAGTASGLIATHESTYSHANYNSAYNHISNNGTDHSYIDQDVQASASPSFAGLTIDSDTLVVGSDLATFTGPSFPVATFNRLLTAQTTGAWTINRFLATTTGNMADNFGPAFVFSIEDNADTVNDIVIMGAYRQASDISGRFQIRTKSAGSYQATGWNITKDNRVGHGIITPTRDYHLYRNANDDVIILVENPNTGANAHAGIKLANDQGNSDGAVMAFFPSNHATAGNVMYFRNYEGDIKMLVEASSSFGFGVGTSIADANDLTIDSSGDVDVLNNLTAGTIQADDGFTGSWVNNEGDTVTVVGGVITSVAA